MKRLLFVSLLIWIVATNAVMATYSACPHGSLSPMVEMSNMAHPSGHSSHDQMKADKSVISSHCSEMSAGVSCDSADNYSCEGCQLHCGGGVLLLETVAPAIASPGLKYSVVLSVFQPVELQRLLRPPRFS